MEENQVANPHCPESQANEEISKNLVIMKNLLYGDGGEAACLDRLALNSWVYNNVENEPNPENVTQLATEVINNDLLVLLIHNIQGFEFEVTFVLVSALSILKSYPLHICRLKKMLPRYSIICCEGNWERDFPLLIILVASLNC